MFFGELLAACDAELTGDPVHLRSNLNNGFKRRPGARGGVGRVSVAPADGGRYAAHPSTRTRRPSLPTSRISASRP